MHIINCWGRVRKIWIICKMLCCLLWGWWWSRRVGHKTIVWLLLQYCKLFTWMKLSHRMSFQVNTTHSCSRFWWNSNKVCEHLIMLISDSFFKLNQFNQLNLKNGNWNYQTDIIRFQLLKFWFYFYKCFCCSARVELNFNFCKKKKSIKT